MTLYLLTALVATVQAAITLHPNGDASYCLDARGDASNGPNNPVIARTYVPPTTRADSSRPCEQTGGYPIPSQVFDWRGTELRLDETDPPRCLRSTSGLASLGDCDSQSWIYDNVYEVIRDGTEGLCLDPLEIGGMVHISECQLCPSVMNWTITEL